MKYSVWLLALFAFPSLALAADKPNLVYILADDLGYGDVSCLNKDSKIRTPNIDKLAAGGRIFTDAHSPSAVCTPTRYGILTGRYAWRTHLRSGVLWGYSKPLIPRNRLTVAHLLRLKGYHSACIGKWHLGMNWAIGEPSDEKAWKKELGPPNVDWTQAIANGPTTAGFDYYYGISASLDMPPYCFIENDRTVGIPSATKTIFRGRPGAAHPDFEAEQVLPALTKKACDYIDQRAKEAKEKEKPFFLYLPLNSPHTPIAPSAEFRGKSGLGGYADFVLQTDWALGQVLEALDRNGLAAGTLVVFTSDNGCSPEAGFKKLAEQGHNPNYLFRGNKADIFEGGHRVPFIARWPGKVEAGSTCAETICLTDLLATCAEIVGAKLTDNAGEDSVSILPALLGTAKAPVREATVHQSIDGSLAIRQGQWKLALCGDSGGWSAPRPGPGSPAEAGRPPVQLYDLSRDIGEKQNLQAEHPDVVARLTALLQAYIDNGRSTPGKAQGNDVEVPMSRLSKVKMQK